MLILDFKFEYFFLSYHLLVNFCRKWITVEPVSNQDEFGHGLRISKGGKPKRSVQASADNTGELSVSKPPFFFRFVLFGIIYIYIKKKLLKGGNEEMKKNTTELAFRQELTCFSLFFSRKMKETDCISLHRSLHSF